MSSRALCVALFVWAPLSALAGRGSIDVEQFRPQIDGRGLFSAVSADSHGSLQFGVGLMFDYEKSPLAAVPLSGGRTTVSDFVSDRFTGELLLSLGFTRWLGVGVALPFALANEANASSNALQGGSGVTGLASMRFELKLRLLFEGI